MDCLFTILQRKQVLNNRCLITNVSLDFTGSRGKLNKTLQKCFATHIHRPLSLLQSWWEGITLGALGALVGCCIQAPCAAEQLCNAFCSHQQCQRRKQGPSMLGKWEAYSIPLCLPWSCNGLERDWRGLWCSGTRQEGGDHVSQWECSSDKQGGKRQGVGRSSCSGVREDKSPWLWSIQFLYSWDTLTQHQFCLFWGQKETQIHVETRPRVRSITYAGPCTIH